MQTKLQLYQEVSEQASKRLWSDTDYFRSFLVTSARLYKYRFKDQMMIHDQRPNAVACAEYDTWGREDIANRFIKRGSKGIALIDDSKDKTRLRYVFDFADTSPRDDRSKVPFFWSITEENRQLSLQACLHVLFHSAFFAVYALIRCHSFCKTHRFSRCFCFSGF